MTRNLLRVLALTAFVLAGGTAGADPISALFKLGRFGRTAEEAGSAARVARTTKFFENAVPELRVAAQGGQALQFEKALSEVNLAISTNRIRIDLSAFTRLFQVGDNERQQWNGGVALAGNLPNVIVKAPQMEGAAEALRIFAHERLKYQLAKAFDVQDVKIIPLGLADNAKASALEQAAFRRTIPAAQYDSVGSLSRIGQKQALTRREALEELKPYSGKTVIFVGHVDEQNNSFFVFLPSGEKRFIPISDWLAAADEANVNVIPIGCNSERLGSIGARGLQNSADVRHALRQMIERNPKTIDAFLETLTDDKLRIVIDPLAVNIFDNGVKIQSRATQETVANVAFNGLRSSQSFRGLTFDVPSSVRVPTRLDPCFASATPQAFDGCVQKIRDEDQKAVQAETQDCHEKNLVVLPILIDHANRKFLWKKIQYSIYVGTQLLATLLLVYLAFVATDARKDEQDLGVSWRNIFGRRRFREIWFDLMSRRGPKESNLFYKSYKTVVIFAMSSSALYLDKIGFWAAPFAMLDVLLFGLACEYGKQAFNQQSLVDFMVSLCCVALITTVIVNIATQSDVFNAERDRDRYVEAFRNTSDLALRPPFCYQLHASDA